MRCNPLVAASLILLCAAPLRANDEGARAAADQASSWLRDHQSAKGSWSTFDLNCEVKPACSGRPLDLWSIGVDGLALYALLESGKGGDPAYKECVERSVAYLLAQQSQHGAIGFGSDGRGIYNHALGLLALARYLREFPATELRSKVSRAVDWAIAAQNPRLGWKYGVRMGRNDTSVTVWMARALAEAQRAKITLKDGVPTGAKRWLERATAPSGATGYEFPGSGSSKLKVNEGKFDDSSAITGLGLWGRLLCGERPSSQQARAALALLMKERPIWRKRKLNFYGWHAGTQALSRVGGQELSSWRKSLHGALLPNQTTQGCSKGSWPPEAEWSVVGGRAYGTALNLLSLTRSLEPEGCFFREDRTRATHGGLLLGSLRAAVIVEALVTPDLIELFFYDAAGEPIPLDGVTGTGVVTVHHSSERRRPRKIQVTLKPLLERRPWHHSIYAKCRIGDKKTRAVDVELSILGLPGRQEPLSCSAAFERSKFAGKPGNSCWACQGAADEANPGADRK